MSPLFFVQLYLGFSIVTGTEGSKAFEITATGSLQPVPNYKILSALESRKREFYREGEVLLSPLRELYYCKKRSDHLNLVRDSINELLQTLSNQIKFGPPAAGKGSSCARWGYSQAL